MLDHLFLWPHRFLKRGRNQRTLSAADHERQTQEKGDRGKTSGGPGPPSNLLLDQYGSATQTVRNLQRARPSFYGVKTLHDGKDHSGDHPSLYLSLFHAAERYQITPAGNGFDSNGNEIRPDN